MEFTWENWTDYRKNLFAPQSVTDRFQCGMEAVSREAAVALVRRFSRVPLADLFCGRADMDAMLALTGELRDCPGVDTGSYGGFCPVFRLALLRDNGMPLPGASAVKNDPYRPVWGTRVNNAIVLLGLILLDHAKGIWTPRDIFRFTRMTLAQYLDAIEDLCLRRDGELYQYRRRWMDKFLENYDGSTPLADVLESIMRDYAAAQWEFHRIDCLLAGEHPGDVPDPGAAAPGTVRGKLFLRERDYRPANLRALAAEAPSPEFRALLKDAIREDRLACAMLEINTAVPKLYSLLVDPYMTALSTAQDAADKEAVSPEAAVELVRRLSGLPTALLFCGTEDVEAIYRLIGKALDDPSMGVERYSGFCRCIQLAVFQAEELFNRAAQGAETDPYRPLWGVRVNNAIVLLGLMLLDHMKDRMARKDIYDCTRMTLDQYLDALETLGACQIWADELRRTDGSRPLAAVVENMLDRYLKAWQVFDRLDHILRCMGGLASCLEGEGGTARRFRDALRRYAPDLEGREPVVAGAQYPDPNGYFYMLACEYPGKLPDLGGDIPPGSVRSQVFLPERDYRPDVLRWLASLSPSPELRELLEKHIAEDRLASAMRELNLAVVDLQWLLVSPFLRL